MAKLVILIGAGASYDCSGASALRVGSRRPPLVTELFSYEPWYAERLHQYPLAEAAAADIRPAVRNGAVAIEEFLRTRLRESTDPYALRRYRQVPLYLQHLLLDISRADGSGYTTHPDNYDALNNAALELDDVIYLSLNYDTLLDERLFLYAPQTRTLDSYIAADTNWCLIKLHGSVNWARRVTTLTDAHYDDSLPITNRLFDEIAPFELSDTIEYREGSINRMRYETRQLYYPALSVPLGSEDELSCPQTHIEHVRERLRTHEGLNLLVIGYSGLDREALTLLAEAGLAFRSMRVVNGNRELSTNAGNKIKPALGYGAVNDAEAFDGGFSEFVASGSLREYVAALW